MKSTSPLENIRKMKIRQRNEDQAAIEIAGPKSKLQAVKKQLQKNNSLFLKIGNQHQKNQIIKDVVQQFNKQTHSEIDLSKIIKPTNPEKQ